MTENRKTPKLRFKGFTDAWEQRKLDNITDVRDGTHDSPQYVETGHPFITSKNVKDGFINYEDIQHISDKDYEEINKRSKVDKNDILMGMIGTIGNIALVREKPNFAIKNVALIKDIGDVLYHYLYHCLQSNSVAHQLDENLDGGTQKFIALNKIRELIIPVPSEHEQRKIGDYMELLDNLITLHQRKLDRLKNVKKSMLDKMFPKDGEVVPEIRFKGFTDAWEQRKLGDVGTTYTGLSGKAKEDFGHGNGKFITYMNVFSNSVASSEMTEPVEIDDRQNKVISGDVLFTTSSETPEEVGMSSVWLEKSENTYLNSFCFGYRPSIVFEPYYLAYMFRSSSVRKKITFLAQGISRYNISKNKMMNIEIFVPTMSEQQQVGEYFRKLDHLITLHQRKLDKLKNIKKSMLDNMFV